MAARYELATIAKQLTTSVAGVMWAIRTGANEIRIVELELSAVQGIGAAGAEDYDFFRTSALGTPTTSQLGVAVDPADAASLTNCDINWSVNPTITGSSLRKNESSGVAGNNLWLHWQPQGGLVVPPNSSVVLNRTTARAGVSALFLVTVAYEE